jgi:hypothetical protein
VTSILYSTHRRTHATFAPIGVRALALVAYTATIGAVHTHGGNAPTPSRFVGATNFVKSSGDNSLSNHRHSDDCLICQLQSHLSCGLFSDLPRVTLPQNNRQSRWSQQFPFSLKHPHHDADERRPQTLCHKPQQAIGRINCARRLSPKSFVVSEPCMFHARRRCTQAAGVSSTQLYTERLN